MPNIPRKNISKILHDVRRGKKTVSRLSAAAAQLPQPKKKLEILAENIRQWNIAPRIKKSLIFKNSWVVKTAIILIFLGINFYAFGLLRFKDLALSKTAVIYEEFNRGRNAFADFEPSAAENAFLNADQELVRLNQSVRNYGLDILAGLFGPIFPPLKELPAALDNITELNQTGLAVAQNLNYLSQNGLSLAFNNGGGQIIATLENLSRNLEALTAISQKIKNQSSQLQKISSQAASLLNSFDENYLHVSVDLYKAREWLASLIALLKSPGEQHFLLIFQNPSEMRPAGGFIGSHADLALNKASVKYLAVDDIYNADRQMDLKIIPPKPLQSITAKWGARDANWFFNFPTSAAKVIYFLENSKLYQDRNITFFGAAAINVNVLESLLEITGPIEVPQYQMTLNAENFLREVQYEVEAGRDKKPGQNPKKILSVVAPLILERLIGLSEEQKSVLMKKLQYHFQNKDIMVYFRDLELQDFAAEMGIAGEVFPLPGNYSGDYLAVVNANIASGKTDAFIKQKIILKSELSGDGSIQNQLTIERAHSGQNEPEWWYRTENKNFIKIFTPPNPTLYSVTNNDFKIINPLVDYKEYRTDPDLYSVESASILTKFQTEFGQENGKNYFGAWFNVKAGDAKTLELKYALPRRVIIQDGATYQFIFEKQSGINGSLEYTVAAPYGYVWKETKTDIFRFQTKNPKAREIINLTLSRS